MEAEEIITRILSHLNGFSTDSTDMNANKIVTEEEIINTYNSVIHSAQSYCNLKKVPVDDARFNEGVIVWSSGVLYKKYDERPNDQIDETHPVGVGDQLIIRAREILKPYKYFRIDIY